MKRLLIFIIVVLLSICLKSASNDGNLLLGKNYLKEMNMKNFSVLDYEFISDFDNHNYLLYNFSPQGYAIFSKEQMSFIEGSFATNSLYQKYLEEKYYIGPLNYYIKKANNYYNLIDEKSYQPEELTTASKNFYDLINFKTNDNNNLSVDLPDNFLKEDNWTYIQNYQYFKNLYDFPDNVDGSCGFVALAMILGYLDTFYDDSILDNKYIRQTKEDYSRGTTDDLQYLLIDYGHYIKIPFTEVTSAATARNIYDTFSEYRREFIPIPAWKNSFILYHEAPLLGYSIPTEEIKYLLDKGKPVILVMRNYRYQTDETSPSITNSWHNIIAYGYNGDKFITHFGWNTQGANQFILSSAVIQSYITIDYFS